MAAKDEDDILYSCSICLERFIYPKTLSCDHSFCTLCLTGYIEQLYKTKTVRSKHGFNCPCCRKFIEFPDSDLDITKWVEALPVLDTLMACVSSIATNNVSALSSMCGECKQENTDVKAEFYCIECEDYLCTNCKRYHMRNKMLSKHKLVDLSAGNDCSNVELLKDLGKCGKHNSVDVKCLCMDHNEYCCEHCVIAHHRKCDNILTMENILDRSGGNITIRDAKNGHDDLMNDCDALLRFHETQESALYSSRDAFQAQVGKIKDNINEIADECVSRINEQYRHIQKVKTTHISEETGIIDTVKNKIVHAKSVVETASKYGNKLQSFFATLKMKECIDENKKYLLLRYKDPKLETVQLRGLQSVQIDLHTALNKINLQIVKRSVSIVGRQTHFQVRHPVLKMEMDIKGTGTIDDCKWISKDVVIISERDRASFALIDLKDRNVTERHELPSSPGNMTLVSLNRLAVLFPSEKKVRVIKLNGSNFSCGQVINVSERCRGIAYNRYSNSIYVISSLCGNIECYCMRTGNQAGNIPISISTQSDIRRSTYIAYSEHLKQLYVSCFSNHKVVAIAIDGTIVFEYKHEPFKYPYGISLDCEGNLYICWTGGNSVHQVDKTGTFVRELLAAHVARDTWHLKAFELSNDMDSFVVVCNGALHYYKFEESAVDK